MAKLYGQFNIIQVCLFFFLFYFVEQYCFYYLIQILCGICGPVGLSVANHAMKEAGCARESAQLGEIWTVDYLSLKHCLVTLNRVHHVSNHFVL